MTSANLKRSAHRVQEALQTRGFDFKVIELSQSTRTAQDAATALGCEVAQIVKSLIFRTVETDQAILVLASGVNRVDENTIAEFLGEGVTKADAEFIRDVTGYAIGGVPPIGHKSHLQTLIDQDLMRYDELWAAAGTPNSVFCLKSHSLPQLTDGILIDIK